MRLESFHMHCFPAASGLHLYDKHVPSLRFVPPFIFVSGIDHCSFSLHVYACTWSSHSQLHTLYIYRYFSFSLFLFCILFILEK